MEEYFERKKTKPLQLETQKIRAKQKLNWAALIKDVGSRTSYFTVTLFSFA